MRNLQSRKRHTPHVVNPMLMASSVCPVNFPHRPSHEKLYRKTDAPVDISNRPLENKEKQRLRFQNWRRSQGATALKDFCTHSRLNDKMDLSLGFGARNLDDTQVHRCLRKI